MLDRLHWCAKQRNRTSMLPGEMSVHLVLIYTLAFSNVLLVLALNYMVHKSSYCKCSLAWCQVRTFLLFTIWTHPLQKREYPLRYAGTDKNFKNRTITFICYLWIDYKDFFFFFFFLPLNDYVFVLDLCLHHTLNILYFCWILKHWSLVTLWAASYPTLYF